MSYTENFRFSRMQIIVHALGKSHSVHYIWKSSHINLSLKNIGSENAAKFSKCPLYKGKIAAHVIFQATCLIILNYQTALISFSNVNLFRISNAYCLTLRVG